MIEAGRQQEQRGDAPDGRQAGDAMTQQRCHRIDQYTAEHVGKQVGRQVGKIEVRQHHRHRANRNGQHDGNDGMGQFRPGVEAVVHYVARSGKGTIVTVRRTTFPGPARLGFLRVLFC